MVIEIEIVPEGMAVYNVEDKVEIFRGTISDVRDYLDYLENQEHLKNWTEFRASNFLRWIGLSH
jgi:predicted HicB family RNase H-like nuclease